MADNKSTLNAGSDLTMATNAQDLGGSDKPATKVTEAEKKASTAKLDDAPLVENAPDPDEDDLDDLDGEFCLDLGVSYS